MKINRYSWTYSYIHTHVNGTVLLNLVSITGMSTTLGQTLTANVFIWQVAVSCNKVLLSFIDTIVIHEMLSISKIDCVEYDFQKTILKIGIPDVFSWTIPCNV